MLPLCERLVHIPKGKYLPSENRGTPIPKEPQTIGEHLRRRRVELRLFQAQAARRLRVSTVTLSRWECDFLHPSWPYWQRITEYLGYDPFMNPSLGRPKGNESTGVAALSNEPALTLGQKLFKWRMAHRRNAKQMARKLDVDAKTLRAWEVGGHEPSAYQLKSIMQILAL